jgi:hypothetical protein
MVQAGKLTSIEEAIAGILTSSPSLTSSSSSTSAVSNVGQALPPATAPKPTPTPAATAPQPPPIDDWRAKIRDAMAAAGLTFSADAMAQADVQLNNNELLITASKEYQLDLGRDEISTALKQLGYPNMRFKVVFGTPKPAPAGPAAAAAPKKEDEVTARALANPEVQRFREVFGGEVRTVRDLKEPWND